MANKSLPVLIKIAGRKVESVQQGLARVRAALEVNAARQKQLEQDAAVAFVQAVAEDDLVELQAAGAFQERMRREVAALREQQAVLERDEATQKQALQEAYAEQKRYELLLEKQQLADKRAHERKVQQGLDEVAGTLRRK